MHVGAVLLIEGDAPAYDDFVDHVGSRLSMVPRYRQRLAPVPLGQGRPKWVDDDDFDLRYHVRSTALPAPGSERELKTLAARVFQNNLDREKPLWEMWLISGLEGGRFAILSKTHHALVDGISGLDILSVLFAPDDEEQRTESRRLAAPAGAGRAAPAGRGAPRARHPADRAAARRARDRPPPAGGRREGI